MPTATYSGLSYVFYQGDGSSKTFPLSFNYLDPSHVVVKVDGTVKTAVDDYNILPSGLVFVTAPASGADIRVNRVTPKEYEDRLVDFRAYGTITEDEMDLNQKQLWYLIQEAAETDDAGDINPNAAYLQWDESSDVWTAIRSGVPQRIANVEDPASGSDAATKDYVDDIAEWGIAGVPQSWTFTAGAAQTQYTLTGGQFLDARYLIVSINGVIQRPNVDFTVNSGSPNSELVFGAGTAATGQQISVQNFGKARFLNALVLGANSVPSSALQDGSVTTSKLASDAVTQSKIADDAVGPDQIEDSAVTAAAIAAGTITFDKLKQTGFMTPIGGTKHPVIRMDKDTGNMTAAPLGVLDLTGFDAELAAKSLSTFAVPTGSLSMGSQRITDVTNPTGAQDAATKDYVDTVVGGGSSGPRVDLVHDSTTGAAATNVVAFGGPSGAPAWLTDSTYLFYEVYISNFRHDGPRLTLQVYQSGAWTSIEEFWYLPVTPAYRTYAFGFTMTQPRDGSKQVMFHPKFGGGNVMPIQTTIPYGPIEGLRFLGTGGTSGITIIGANLRVMVYGHRALT